ncbi:hypothetical protein BV22DRAFT_1135856 [Leucogyrophana mollusca]|uniref:Uncharacterized protein n=1 Tax=Leucogyrophana mollusca TaxID=85980 RepID=A0ACB8AUN3_9AGAM|nr:hypothetical protein BV22DRAFT_1135856 [Leucogyrophana mollusca]
MLSNTLSGGAVKGVDAVEHIASPVTFDAEDPYELITPAINGTVGMLHSVLKHGWSGTLENIPQLLSATHTSVER